MSSYALCFTWTTAGLCLVPAPWEVQLVGSRSPFCRDPKCGVPMPAISLGAQLVCAGPSSMGSPAVECLGQYFTGHPIDWWVPR